MTPAERLNNQATKLYAAGHRQTAMAYVRQALELDPKNPVFGANLGVLLTNLGEYQEAQRVFHELITNNVNNVLAWHGLGVLFLVSANPSLASECFQKCRQLEPRQSIHDFDHACATLQAGDWGEGFKLYECRRKDRSDFPVPLWDGSPNRSVYVWAEQGIGDTIQFARYLPWLRSISNRVTFAVPPYLMGLFKRYSEAVDIVSLTAAQVDADCHIPLMSLVHHYGTHQGNVLPDPRYLKRAFSGYSPLTPVELNGRLKVGLCWACNSTSINYKERSVDFQELIRLCEVPNTDFYSLQVGPPSSDISKHQAQGLVKDLSGWIGEDWELTASVIGQLDVVVSTDTSVAHLAAAMDKPTYMFLARRDWWRWGNFGEETPWYPSMKIIRANKPHEWKKEILRAKNLLEAYRAPASLTKAA